jgi:hypothetical protein
MTLEYFYNIYIQNLCLSTAYVIIKLLVEKDLLVIRLLKIQKLCAEAVAAAAAANSNHISFLVADVKIAIQPVVSTNTTFTRSGS